MAKQLQQLQPILAHEPPVAASNTVTTYTTRHAPTGNVLRTSARKSKRGQPYPSTLPVPVASGTATVAGKRDGPACQACHQIHKKCVGHIPCKRCVAAGRAEQCVEHKRRKIRSAASPAMRRLGAIASVAVSSASGVQVAPSGASDIVSSTSVAAAASSITVTAVSTAPMMASSAPQMASPTSESSTQLDPYMIQNHGVGFIGQTFPPVGHRDDWAGVHQPHFPPGFFPPFVQDRDILLTGNHVGGRAGHDMPVMQNNAGYYPLRNLGGIRSAIRNPFFAPENEFGTLAPSAPQFGVLMDTVSSNYAPGNAEVQGHWAQQWLNILPTGFDESVDARQQSSAVPGVSYFSRA